MSLSFPMLCINLGIRWKATFAALGELIIVRDVYLGR